MTGRFVVALPFKENINQFGSSREIAFKRFKLLEKRFKSDKKFEEQFSKIMEEYIELNHMSQSKNLNNNEGYYLPNHAVIKESSNFTKLRVVFDASAKTSSGVSLNDTLMTGPTIQDDIFTLLLRYRSHFYVFTADIEKMYRQFLVQS